MEGIENFTGFLVLAILMNLTPGSDSIYIITRSIAQGKKAGIYSVLGVGSGAVVHIILSAFGLSVLLSKSLLFFTFIKWLGALYLIYLGIRMLFEKSNLLTVDNSNFSKVDLWKIYRQGFYTNILNPKVALFFLSLLPQFILTDYESSPVPFLILGTTFLSTGILWCLFLAFAASFMTKVLRNNNTTGRFMKKISGCVFVGLGIQVLFRKG